jgi:hypothetical protein
MSGYTIFIGYRRKDVAGEAGRIYDRLCSSFGRGRVFKDVESIQPGADFRSHVIQVVGAAEVFLALIGERWGEFKNRLTEDGDLVRIELEVALRSEVVQVIPVLIGQAHMPAESDLPGSIRDLARLQAVSVRQDPDFHADMSRLIRKLSKRDEFGAVEVVDETEGSDIDARAAALWAQIENSLDKAAYQKFADNYASTSEGKTAQRAVKALDVWRTLDRTDPRKIQKFAADIEGKVPFGVSSMVASHLRVAISNNIKRNDYKSFGRSRDLKIIGCSERSSKDDWAVAYQRWKQLLDPETYPPRQFPAVAQKLHRIRMAYNRLLLFA